MSSSPVFPGRLHLALITVAASLLAGISVAVLTDLVRPTFDDARSLRMFSGRPVLGSVSQLLTPADMSLRHIRRLRVAIATLALLGAQAGWVAWVAVKPALY